MRPFLNDACMKVLVEDYYRRNSGFFFVLVLFLFGFFTAEHHRLLADMAVLNPKALVLVYFLPWTAYLLKTVSWTSSALRMPENDFLRNLVLLPRLKLWTQFFLVQLLLFLPVFLFVFLLISRMIVLHKPESAWYLLAYFLLVLALPPFLYIRNLLRPANAGQNWQLPVLLRFLPVPGGWFLRSLLFGDLAVFFLSKLLSIFLTAGSCALFFTDDYDGRIVLLGVLFAGFVHLGLSELHFSLERKLAFLRNFPRSSFERFSSMAFSWFFVLLPELFVLLRNCPSALGREFGFFAAALFFSLVLFLSNLQYLIACMPKGKERILPVCFFVLAFGIMSRLPAEILMLILLLSAWFLNKYFYYKVEVYES